MSHEHKPVQIKDRADLTFSDKVLSAGGLGGIVGGLYGVVNAAWVDAPAVRRGNVAPALVDTFKIFGRNAAIFAVTGAIFAGTEHVIENVREKKDIFNSAIAGCVAGTVFGLRTGRATVAAGGCAAFAIGGAAADVLSSWNQGSKPGSLQHRELYHPKKEAVSEAAASDE